MISKEIKKDFLRLYELGLSTKEICESLGIESQKGYSIIRSEKLKSHGSSLSNKKEVELIKKEYLEGLTIKDIHEKYPHLTEGKINYWIRKEKIARPRGNQKKLNENYFSIIDTPQKAYFLGLLMADGSVVNYKNKWTISLELKKEDSYIIEKLIEEVDSDKTINILQRKESSTFKEKTYNYLKCNSYVRFHSKKMSADLEKWGVVPRKTFKNNKLPHLDDELMRYYILGFYDGDGIASVGKQSYMGFCGDKTFLEELSLKLYELTNLPPKKPYYNKSNGIYYLTYNRNVEEIELYNFLYQNLNISFLGRKKEKIKKYLLSVNPELTL